jgi:hypothetical protein
VGEFKHALTDRWCRTCAASRLEYAAIYAQWGNKLKALEWLETVLRLRDPGLSSLKTDPLVDPLRQEPRFQKVMRELKFP